MILSRSQPRTRFPLLLIVLFLVLLALLVQLLPQISHANARHGGEADLARQCNQAPNMHLFFNPKTNRSGKVCDLNGMFGVVIVDAAGNEVTAFIKNKMTRFEQVLKYMANQGYTLLQ